MSTAVIDRIRKLRALASSAAGKRAGARINQRGQIGASGTRLLGGGS